MQMMSNPNLMRMASESMKTMRLAAEQLKHTRPEEMAEIDDGKNVKALYRRGQAYKELGQLEDAISDLSKAHEVYPGDETVADVLRDAEERLAREGSHQAPQGVAIEEITEEAASTSSANRQTSFTKYSSKQPRENPYTLSALSGGKVGEVSPDLFKTATNMIVHPNVTPDMLKSATDMMTKMPPEELQKMFEAAASLEGNDSISTSTAVKSSRLDSDAESNLPTSTADLQEQMRNQMKDPAVADKDIQTSNTPQQVECTPKQVEFEQMGICPVNKSNSPATMEELEVEEVLTQEPLSTPEPVAVARPRREIRKPARFTDMVAYALPMFASMMKNMSPDIMENMGEQFGLKLSREDANAQQAMASLSPEELDRKMRWVDRIQEGVEGAKKAKNWLLGKPGMILALCMLILAVVLHRLGFIGRLNYLNLHFERESPWKFNFRNYIMLLGLQGEWSVFLSEEIESHDPDS
ncbi:hypothetical protein GOBAR_DD28610 [Gossypium barbadense]|nr:hypothetical protein GOBAR_DD28610 [Gossypium barbadense]